MEVIADFGYIGLPVMLRAQSSHPLEPLSAAEISVAVATVRAAGATPEVCYNTIIHNVLTRNSVWIIDLIILLLIAFFIR